MKNEKNSIRNVKTLVTSAVLTAICMVLAYFAKSIFGDGPIRFTIENLPIIMGGILYGPCIGGLIAVAADLISCLTAGMPPLPLITVGAASVGVVFGVMYRYVLSRMSEKVRIVLSTLSAHVVGSMAIKTYALYGIFKEVVLWRIPLYIGISAVEAFILVLLLNNGSFKKQILG